MIQDDYALHFVHAREESLFFKTHYRQWAYSPYHCAGYFTGLFDTLSNNWAFLIMLIFGNLAKPAFIFNLAIFFSYLILPISAFFIARNFNFGKINTLSLVVLAMFLVMGFRKAADLANFYSYGMYGFPLGVFLSFLAASCFYRYIHNKTFYCLIGLTLLGGLALFVHPLSFLICLGLCVPLLIGYFDKIALRDVYKIIGCAIIIFAINMLWIAPLLKFAYLKGSAAGYFQTDSHSLLRVFRKHPSIILFSLFLFSIYRLLKHKKRRFALCILSSWILFFIICFFGSQIKLADIQPYRFILPLMLLSLIPISGIVEGELNKKNFIFIGLLIILSVLLFSRPKKYIFGYYQRYPTAEKIIEFIKENTSNSARIHVQDSVYDPYFGSHFIAFIPYQTSREVVAAPCPSPQDKFAFTQFIDDRIFGKKLSDISDVELEGYLELYNIKYFLVFSEAAHLFFDTNAKFKKVFNTQGYAIYEYLNANESYCYHCNAVVKAGYDKINVKNATSKVTILKYHYLSTLKIKPENLKISPVKLLDDPIPFIMVENGAYSDFVIFNP